MFSELLLGKAEGSRARPFLGATYFTFGYSPRV